MSTPLSDHDVHTAHVILDRVEPTPDGDTSVPPLTVPGLRLDGLAPATVEVAVEAHVRQVLALDAKVRLFSLAQDDDHPTLTVTVDGVLVLTGCVTFTLDSPGG